jgi:hypothetical protein
LYIPRSIGAKLAFDPENNLIHLDRLKMRLANGHILHGRETGMSISGPQIKLSIQGSTGVHLSGSGGALTCAPTLTGQFSTIAVTAPELGQFSD